MSLTSAVAVYAAILSTLGLVWNILAWRRDRRTNLLLTADRLPVWTEGGSEPSKYDLVCRVINRSLNPVVLTDWGFDYVMPETRGTYSGARGHAVRLEPGGFHEFRLPQRIGRVRVWAEVSSKKRHESEWADSE